MKPMAIFRALRIARWLSGERRRWRRVSMSGEEERRAVAHRFVEYLIRQGPAFVKLGQILSTRPDFLPGDYIDALAVLHEHVPPVSYEDIARVVETELGGTVDEHFAAFEREPIASASFAQVYGARLPDDREVVVKIQRPGLRQAVERDLRAIGVLVSVAARIRPKLSRNANLRGAYAQFESYTRAELDFLEEGRTLDRFREVYRDWPDVHFPKPEPQISTSQLLTMERMDGLRLHEVAARCTPEERRRLTERLVEVIMKMFIGDGYFHADLHPGNIFFGHDGTFKVIDVGMVGSISREQRNRFLLYWLAVSQKDTVRALYHIEHLAAPGPGADIDLFRRQFTETLAAFYEATISEQSWARTFFEILTAAARSGYRVPSEMLLEAKGLTTAEALVFTLWPEANFAELARPFVEREMARLAGSESIRRRLARDLPEWILLGESAPPTSLEALPEVDRWQTLWQQVAMVWSAEMERHPYEGREHVHGEAEVIIHKPLHEVFHYVCRLASYEEWHPTYTERSRVIHVGGEWICLTSEVVGSVFRVDEIADGYHVQSNGIVTEYEPYRHFKWRAPFSPLPMLHIGTSFTFEAVDEERTRLYEYFYYVENELMQLVKHRPWLAALSALEHHIEEELNGIKRLLESGRYNETDLTDMWKDVDQPTRVARNYLRPTAVTSGPRFTDTHEAEVSRRAQGGQL